MIEGQLVLRADSSNAHLEPADPVNLPAARVPNIRRAAALRVPADPVLLAHVPALALGPDSAHPGPVGLAVPVPVVEQFRLLAKLRVRSEPQDARAAATSSIQKPRKAR